MTRLHVLFRCHVDDALPNTFVNLFQQHLPLRHPLLRVEGQEDVLGVPGSFPDMFLKLGCGLLFEALFHRKPCVFYA